MQCHYKSIYLKSVQASLVSVMRLSVFILEHSHLLVQLCNPKRNGFPV